ncbi:MAG TPA: glycosyltransferase [Candidatus Acidoferrales bacterium]|nr:glycosyltransferase [Candidatus Acidoferrales bacterium]
MPATLGGPYFDGAVAVLGNQIDDGGRARPGGRRPRLTGRWIVKSLNALALVLALLPVLAILRGAALLLMEPRSQAGGAWVGLALAFVALAMGCLFFAYSIRYLAATAIMLVATRRHPGGPGAPGQAGLPHLTPRPVRGEGPNPELDHYPFVSVQVASYNEVNVIERLLTALANLDYPNYEVIWCDDSTDGTSAIRERWADRPRFKIGHRLHRTGFKGGALAEALKIMDPRTEYVVVFDADSVPFADSLQRFLPHFYDQDGRRKEEIGAVQSYQWHVLNKGESWLTEAVRAEYSGSYMIERPFQNAIGALKMIAGTAYMIRADLLREIGWGRSLTEDWELTLRLYERGKKVVYTPFAETPAECVATLDRLIKQRMRWAEGHSYNVRKHFLSILGSPRVSFAEKLEFAYYSTYYLQALFFAIGSIAWLIAELGLHAHVPEWTAVLGWSLLFSNLVSLPLMNLGGLILEEAPDRDAWGVLGAVFLSYFLVPFQGWAALKGLIEKDEGPWYRTPKTGHMTGPIRHLPNLQLLGRLLMKRLTPGGRPGGRGPSAPRQAPGGPFFPGGSRRLGWVVLGTVFTTLGSLALSAFNAPVAYANPGSLYLQTGFGLASAPGSTPSVAVITNNLPGLTWTSAATYPAGTTVGAGTYTFTLDRTAATCGNGGINACNITVKFGYCEAPCTTQTVQATLTGTMIDTSPNPFVMTASSVPAFTMTGTGPFELFISISTTGANGHNFTLSHGGNTPSVNDSNLALPAITVPEHLLPVLGLALVLPLLAAAWSRRRRHPLAAG